MKKTGDDSAKKLRRILVIHQRLRRKTAGIISAESLAEYCRDQGLECDERTIRADLTIMKQYMNAPLPERANRHEGYFYSEPYSLFEGLDASYLDQLNEIVAMVRQLSGKKEFAGMEDLLLRLEERIQITQAEKNHLIYFEEVSLKGKNHLIDLYTRISNEEFLVIDYEAFDKPSEKRHVYPLMLREYNSRWYLIAWEKDKPFLQNLALDRIKDYRKTKVDFPIAKDFDFNKHYQDFIGVTRHAENLKTRIFLKVNNPIRAQYLITKPIHPSQILISKPGETHIFELNLIPNLELEAKIFEFGPDMEVIEPEKLRKQIAEKARRMSGLYSDLE